MSYSHSLSLPWSVSPEDEQRFRRVLVSVLTLCLVLSIAVPLLPVFQKPVEEEMQLPPRVAKLIFEKRTEPKPIPKPKPKPVEVKQPEKKPAEKTPPKVTEKKPPPQPQPKVDRTVAARKKAARSGLLAMQDSLADLRDQSTDPLRNAKRLSNSATQAREVERSLITSKVSGGSKGINTAKLSRDAGSSQLQSRTATEMVSPVVPASAGAKNATGSNRSAGRSREEVTVVFDRNKSVIYSIYNRELRKDPTLQGKLLLRLTIAPSGEVTEVKIVSSELGHQELERKLLQRVKMFDFGARSVESLTIDFAIDFFPA